MAIDWQKYDSQKLIEPEEENQASLMESIGAGIATGLIKIPEGAASLYANIYDLTNDTDTALEVEKWFDDNVYKKLGNIEEKAEATTAGKITSALVNIGIPGGIAFRYGTKAANWAIKSANKGKYFTLNNPTLAKAGQKALQLNKKGKTARFAAGAVAGGVAEGVFVADVEDFGTIGDLLGGPTELDDLSFKEGKDRAARSILNRVKFGTEGALLTGVIGGTGAAIKKVATRGKALKYSNSLGDRILNGLAKRFRPRGDIPEEAFLTKREQIGKRSKDLTRAVSLSRAVDRDIDRIFPNIKSTFNKTTKAEKELLYKDLEDVLFSGKAGVDDAGRVTMGEMNPQMIETISKKLLNNGANPEHVGNIFQNIGLIRKKWENMAELIHSQLPVTAQPQFRLMIGDQFKGWLGRTYGIFENKSAIPFFNYKPAEEAFNKVVNIFMRQNSRAISRAEATNAAFPTIQKVKVPNRLTYEQASWEVDTILKNATQGDKDILKIMKDTEVTRALRVPTFNIKTDFVKDSVAADLAKTDMFSKRLEQAVRKGRYATIGKEGLPEKTVIGKGSKAFRELFGEMKDVRQKMLHGTERLSMVARKNEFLTNLVERSARRQKEWDALTPELRATAAGGRPFLFGTEGAARATLNNVDVAKYEARPAGSAWGETAAQNPIINAFPDGAWMEKSLAEALDTTQKALFNNKTIGFLYDSLFLFPKATSQFAKTVFSPITHARNFFSAATFQTANGIWFENPKTLAAAWRDAFGALQPQSIKQNSKLAQELYEEAVELGVTNTNARAGDMMRLFQDVGSTFGQGKLATDRVTKMMLQPNWAKKFAKWSQDMYVAEDDFWKLGNWVMERYRYKNAYKRAFDKGLIKEMPTDKQFKSMTADIVRNTVPNYEYVPEFIRSLRKLPVGNFVSFPAEILRTSTGIVQQALKEINDPITRAIGMKRLAGFAATTAVVPPTMVEMFKTIYDYTDDELEALKRFLPNWSKNSTILPMKDEEGNLKYIDFSHGFAYDTVTRPVQTVLNMVAQGETDEKTLMEGFMKGLATSTSELGEPFISESIWTEAFLDVIRGEGKTKDGKVLWTDATPMGERVSAGIAHIVRAQAPFSAQQMIRLGFAAQGKPSKTVGPFRGTGQTYELTDEALGFTGYRPVPIDPARSLDFMMSAYQRSIRNARREFNAELLRGEEVTPQQIVDRYIISNKAKWEAMKDMALNITAGEVLGVNPSKLETVLGRISKKDAEALAYDNYFIPFNISKNVQEVFEENARKLGITNPFYAAEGPLDSLKGMMETFRLDMNEWPDLTDRFNLNPSPLPQGNLQQTPSGASNINPQVYNRLPLTLNPITGLTQTQTALLSPADQVLAQRINRNRLT